MGERGWVDATSRVRAGHAPVREDKRRDHGSGGCVVLPWVYGWMDGLRRCLRRGRGVLTRTAAPGRLAVPRVRACVRAAGGPAWINIQFF